MPIKYQWRKLYSIYCIRTLSAASGARHVKKGEEEALKISNTMVKKIHNKGKNRMIALNSFANVSYDTSYMQS